MLIFYVLFINMGVFFLLSIKLPRFYIFNKNNNYDSLIAVLDIKPRAYNLIGLLIVISFLY